MSMRPALFREALRFQRQRSSQRRTMKSWFACREATLSGARLCRWPPKVWGSVDGIHEHEGHASGVGNVPVCRPNKHDVTAWVPSQPQNWTATNVKRGSIQRTDNAPRHARQIAHVHSVDAFEDELKSKVRCALLFSVCAFQRHTVTGHMRWGHARHRCNVARDTRRTHCGVSTHRAHGGQHFFKN